MPSMLTEDELARLESRRAEGPGEVFRELSPEAQGREVLRLMRDGVTPEQVAGLTAWVEDTFGEQNTILEGSRGQIVYLVKT